MTTTVAGRSAWLHRYAVLVVVSTFGLIFAGGLVTSTGSGLAVPDWPLSFGQLFPRMEGGVLYEHGHRMIATVVGALTVGLYLWLLKAESRRWVRALGLVAVVAVIVQGVLGGLTVLLRLPDATSIAHAGLAQGFLCLVTVLALATSPRWDDDRDAQTHSDDGTRNLALAVLGATYLQILFGALVRHTGSGLVVATFPLAYGRIWPAMQSANVTYHMIHRTFAYAVVLLAVWAAVRVLRRHWSVPRLRAPALALLGLVVWQFFLGALTVWTARAVTPTTLHVVSGAAVLVATLVLVVRTQRILGGGVFSIPLSHDPTIPRL